MNRLHLAVFASTAALGCSHPTPKATAPSTVQPAPAPAPAAMAAPAAQPAVPASPHVAVSSELARQCTLRFNSAPQAPKFDFDRFELLPEDRSVLEQVATCVTTGPLHGHAVQLVGHTDPRGTEEYNLGLGTRRADSVRGYLQRLGVSAGQLSETTRGALDATGTDEASWRVDRRVDLELPSG
jgi:outer membrane protein OmpA-like peptidoglycan-associated protein